MVGRRPLRVPVMALAMVALLTGVWAGLLRLGWQVPLLAATLPGAHGPLMVSGFLGTLIGLEGAVALGRRWAYASPLATALGTAALVTDTPGHPGPILMTLGSLGCVFTNGIIIRRQPALFARILALAVVASKQDRGRRDEQLLQRNPIALQPALPEPAQPHPSRAKM